jgi:hypothetical protein
MELPFFFRRFYQCIFIYTFFFPIFFFFGQKLDPYPQKKKTMEKTSGTNVCKNVEAQPDVVHCKVAAAQTEQKYRAKP